MLIIGLPVIVKSDHEPKALAPGSSDDNENIVTIIPTDVDLSKEKIAKACQAMESVKVTKASLEWPTASVLYDPIQVPNSGVQKAIIAASPASAVMRENVETKAKACDTCKVNPVS